MFTIRRKNYENGVRLSTSNIHDLGVNISVLGAGLKADAVAYVLARVSREKTSLSTLLSLINSQDEVTNQLGIREIIEGYGHSSVRALGHMIVGIEGISIYHSMQTFNLSPLHDGQERSTRYVDINKTNQASDMFFIPTELHTYPELKEKYLSVMRNWMNEFSRTLKLYKVNIQEYYGKELTKKVINKRALDCTRYFLPLGLRTTLILNQNGREWVSLISLFSSSLLEGDRLIGDTLHDLLINTEGGRLIKHINKDINKLNRDALDYIKSVKCTSTQWPTNSSSYTSEMIVSKEGLPLEWAYYVIDNPYTDTFKCENEGTLVNKLMEVSNHHNGLDKRTARITSGLIARGITDIGSIKDLNRHRGMMYIPLVMEGYQLGEGMDYYSIPPYIEEGRLQHLNKDYEDAYIKGMELVDDWFAEAEVKLGKSLAKEVTKYLLPHGFNTPYFLSGDVNRWHYLLNLRKGLDGHISYREWTYKCNELWKNQGITFVPNMSKPNPSSVEEFEYRS